jgi:hypothetical protein
MGKGKKKNKGLHEYSYGQGKASHWAQYEDCHTQQSHVLTIGNTAIWVGAWRDMDQDNTWDLRVRMNDRFRLGSANVKADERARKLLSPLVTAHETPPTLNLDWPDFGAPGMNREWWVQLHADLSLLPEVLKAEDANVAFYCEGGHGRTGTALSILSVLSGDVKENEDPIAWLRNKYCKEAVESWTQIDYIERIIGWEIASQPAGMLRTKGGYTYNYTGKEDDGDTGTWAVVNGVWKKVAETADASNINRQTTMFKDDTNATVSTKAVVHALTRKVV